MLLTARILLHLGLSFDGNPLLDSKGAAKTRAPRYTAELPAHKGLYK